jgi:hypothetical protein
MKRILIFVAFALLVTNISVSNSAQSKQTNQTTREENLQSMVDSLRVGVSKLDDIERLFGKPEKLRRTLEKHDKITMKDRPMIYAEYPSKGLFFFLLANPSELYRFIISTKEVSVHDIRVGDSLQQVTDRMKQEGDWSTMAGDDLWWLDFKKYGVKYGFNKTKNQDTLHRTLVKPELIKKIEVYNSKASIF